MTAWMLVFMLGGCTGNESQGGDGSGGGPADSSGSGSGGPNVNQSGSRIKMNVLRTADGAKSFVGWRDTQLDVDCNFQLAAMTQLDACR